MTLRKLPVTCRTGTSSTAGSEMPKMYATYAPTRTRMGSGWTQLVTGRIGLASVTQGRVWVACLITVALGMLLGAALHTEAIAVLVTVLAMVAFVTTSPHEKAYAPTMLIWLLALQNVLIGIGAHIGGNESTNLSLLTQVPFATTGILYLDVLIDRIDEPMLTKRNKWFALLVIWSCLMATVGGTGITARLVSLRNLTVFFMSWRIATHWLRSERQREAFRASLVRLCVFVTILGIIGLTLSYDTWRSLGLAEVYVAKGSSMPLDGWGGRFVTSLDGKHDILRMISTYYEPVNLAYLLAAGLLCEAVSRRSEITHVISMGIITLGLVLTFGKGGLVIVSLSLLYLLMCHKHLGSVRSRKCSIIATIAVGAVIMIAYYMLIGGAVRPHFWAVERTLASVIRRPLGHGLGTGGNASRFFTNMTMDDDLLAVGGESALMSFGYQIGLVGLIALFMSMRAMATVEGRRPRDTYASALAYALPFVLLLVALLQDNTFAPQCIVPFMLLVGSITGDGEAGGHSAKP